MGPYDTITRFWGGPGILSWINSVFSNLFNYIKTLHITPGIYTIIPPPRR